jgi:hypothetical protein
MFRGAVGSAGGMEQGMKIGVIERRRWARTKFRFIETRSIPVMGLEESANVRSTMYFDEMAGLLDINSVEGVGESKVDKRVGGFRW